ncbi:hypothetical protein CC1G_05209 [Coprinopsis cinerea okayama7|uniref:Uncharacterized protein n=1 Tax=Coprinopsis cinerea (strain Okayama-7 / 130 / ATCC MYA-4618 / FGSC 9003) TaxID=240176 RepID=A8PC61_COPC7|nr:hypothetical protein CC1G_05209 [Coprinopsis cinerea okayama7\|eukprot:XP_001840323.2 hypothetical protein CC1G_05209 [Coprinopsis cinerea okayama7\
MPRTSTKPPPPPPTVQTRSQTRKQQQLQVGHNAVVSPSATGKGTHVRWKYTASGRTPSPVPSEVTPPRKQRPVKLSSRSSTGSLDDSLFEGPLTPLSSSSFSSVEYRRSESPVEDVPITPETSPEKKPFPPVALYTPPSTPPRSKTKPLVRSPLQRWTIEGTSRRLVFIPDDEYLSEEAIVRRLAEDKQAQQEIFERELQRLMQHKKRVDNALKWAEQSAEEAESGEGYTTDGSEESSAVTESISGSSKPSSRRGGAGGLVRGDTEIIESQPTIRELSPLTQYPSEWLVEQSNPLRRRPTDLISETSGSP